MPWQVILIRPPRINDFGSDFFPRKFAYKRDAQQLKEEVKHKGGEARVERTK
jgi:hypothetical protein